MLNRVPLCRDTKKEILVALEKLTEAQLQWVLATILEVSEITR